MQVVTPCQTLRQDFRASCCLVQRRIRAISEGNSRQLIRLSPLYPPPNASPGSWLSSGGLNPSTQQRAEASAYAKANRPSSSAIAAQPRQSQGVAEPAGPIALRGTRQGRSSKQQSLQRRTMSMARQLSQSCHATQPSLTAASCIRGHQARPWQGQKAGSLGQGRCNGVAKAG